LMRVCLWSLTDPELGPEAKDDGVSTINPEARPVRTDQMSRKKKPVISDLQGRHRTFHEHFLPDFG